MSQKIDQLRGWRISSFTRFGRTTWTAMRHGVGMNNDDYDELIRMILARPFWWEKEERWMPGIQL